MEETDTLLSARCPHCRRTVLLEPASSREGAVFECPWPDCSQQVVLRGAFLTSPAEILRAVIGNLPSPTG